MTKSELKEIIKECFDELQESTEEVAVDEEFQAEYDTAMFIYESVICENEGDDKVLDDDQLKGIIGPLKKKLEKMANDKFFEKQKDGIDANLAGNLVKSEMKKEIADMKKKQNLSAAAVAALTAAVVAAIAVAKSKAKKKKEKEEKKED